MLPILDIFLGDQLAKQATQTNIIDALFSGPYLYIIGAFVFFYIVFFIIFFIIPFFRKKPAVYYKRYLKVRKELQRIDDLYNDKKISFDDYTYSQFNYAKEFETIVTYLAKFPEYKKKISSYTLKESSSQENLDEDAKKKKAEENHINFLVNLLEPQAKFYKIEEIEQALLDEGISKDIAVKTVAKLIAQGVKFDSETKDKTSRMVNLVNKLFMAKDDPEEVEEPKVSGFRKKRTQKEVSVPEIEKPKSDDSIDLKKALAPQDPKKDPFAQKLDFDISEIEKVDEQKENIFENLKNIVSKKKKKSHSVSEITDIFKDIEESLKSND